MQLYSKLLIRNYTPIYIPAASFTSNGFYTSANFCREVLKLISSQTIENFSKYNSFKNRVLKHILDTSPDLVLLIDGLDEHEAMKKDINLKHFFNWIRDVKAIPVFSMRKEFWEERYGNITMAVGATRKVQDKIILSEWTNKDITAYIDLYLNHNKKLKKSQINRIKSLSEIVIRDEYKIYYGDIPKRPLFLEMIISDVINDEIKNRNLSELYEIYFKNKIYRDRAGSFDTFSPQRTLPFEMDVYKLCGIIFKILEKCTSKMYIVENQKIILKNEISSSDLDEFMKESNFTDILDILLHSVLVTSKERNNDDLQLRFAHFSFLEFFFAHRISKEVCFEGQKHWLDYYYEESTFKFIEEIISNGGNNYVNDSFIQKKQ